MKKYEITFIVRPDLEENAVAAVAETMKNILTTNNSKVVEEKALGQKEMAYEMKKYKNGIYYFFVVEASNADAINEFDRLATLNEDILRHLVIRVEA